MKVEELIGRKVWIKTDQFRSVPGKIVSTSNAINLDDIKSSVSQSTFKIEMLSGDVIEILGSNITKIENAGCVPAKPSGTSCAVLAHIGDEAGGRCWDYHLMTHRARAALFIIAILVAEVFAARSHLHRLGVVFLLAIVSILVVGAVGAWSRHRA